ncbi:hypothetical protein FOPG_19535 [Fusarium oxysporum f. sp. conglutinans race 2 54008]|uniref:Uncharacterized protein n=1 Tax=Fusarium oxysporum f. sp. conglutinans race 2 54008 TaxID=1089457 RepID=X0HSN3_FUSOX|nr:hypothetical protein FOPG_19535 [Fusarium oxysporum f. sp. conglutinans race 2 54008]
MSCKVSRHPQRCNMLRGGLQKRRDNSVVFSTDMGSAMITLLVT